MNACKVGGKEYQIRMPEYETAWELGVCVWESRVRGAAAVLGVCCVGLTRLQYEAHGCNATRYGTAVWRELRAAGVSESEIIEAATPIGAELAAIAFPAKVEEKVAFFSPSEDTKTSSP
jgi:hypothetical protein